MTRSYTQVHYYWVGIPFEMPCFCRPLFAVRRSTRDPKKVTCQMCLTKMAKYGIVPPGPAVGEGNDAA